jgi:hypothetical protein
MQLTIYGRVARIRLLAFVYLEDRPMTKQQLDKTNKRKPDARLRPARLIVRREFKGSISVADALLPIIAEDIANRTINKDDATQ